MRRRRANIGRTIVPVISDKGQTCRVIETVELTDALSNQMVQYAFTLAQFARASNIAPNFKFYRAAKVIYTYDPLYNTFQDGVNAASKPYLYVSMNRTQLAEATAMAKLEQIQNTGARPIPFATQRKVTYKPNWCSPGLLQVRTNADGSKDFANNGLQAQYGWLACPNYQGGLVLADQVSGDNGAYPLNQSHPPPGGSPYVNQFTNLNTVLYNGHWSFIDQKFTGGETLEDPVGRITMTVVWEFKGAQNPLNMSSSEETLPLASLAGASKTPSATA